MTKRLAAVIQEDNVSKFWELLQESVIVQGLVTVALVGTLCTMFLMGRTVPDLLMQITLLVLGFWFGAKSQYANAKHAKELAEATRK